MRLSGEHQLKLEQLRLLIESSSHDIFVSNVNAQVGSSILGILSHITRIVPQITVGFRLTLNMGARKN